MAEQIQEKNDWNFGKMIKGDERLNTYVFEAADFLAPFFGLDIMKILPDIPVADFFDKYRAIFGGSLVGWQLDASFFYIPPPQRIPLDPEPGEKLDDFVIEGGKYFKLVYSDEANLPLSIYNGRIIGPLKIWEVSYPEDLEVPEIYYEDVLPNPKVSSIEGRY